MEHVERLRLERRSYGQLRQANLGRFAEPSEVDPETGERLCIEPGCGAVASGRGKLCASHRADRASLRASRQGRHPTSRDPTEH
jgi:hypothetical protein